MPTILIPTKKSRGYVSELEPLELDHVVGLRLGGSPYADSTPDPVLYLIDPETRDVRLQEVCEAYDLSRRLKEWAGQEEHLKRMQGVNSDGEVVDAHSVSFVAVGGRDPH